MTAGNSEQRRSRRFHSNIDVDITDRKGTRRGRALDVARHGLFVMVAEVPANRHLVQLRIQLPDGDVRAAATVTRALPGQGVGLSLFALSDDAKSRWDTWVGHAQLAWAEDLARREVDHTSTARTARSATFFVRLHSVERLREYQRLHVEVGGTILFTPALVPAGSPVTLLVVHPVTQAEFPLHGSVHRAIRAAPKRLEILFSVVDGAAFERFVDDGAAPSAPTGEVPAAADADDAAEDLDFDIDDAVVGDDPVGWRLDCPLPGGGELAPETTAARAAPTAIARDEHELDFAVDVRDPTLLSREAEPDPSLPGTPPPRDDAVLDDAHEPDPDGLHARRVRVACNRCDAVPYVVELGPCDGTLALVADLTPFWCPSTGRVVTVPRLVPLAKRKARLDHYLKTRGALDDQTALADVLAAAALAESPQHPQTGEILRSTRALERLAAAAAHLVDGSAPSAATRVPCASCDHGHLVLTPA